MLDRITALTAEGGLSRYEVSAYARTGHRCVHNLNYWQFGDYLGIGAGAHGKLSFAHRIVRQVRYRQPDSYMAHALSGAAVAEEHELGRADLPFEFMLNALRLKNGFNLDEYPEKTGLSVDTVEPQLHEAERQGWIGRDGSWIQPTAHGFDFLNDLQELFLPD
jgi:oxygen-independent coproporphyrinogen-3 oxidase